MTVPIIRLDCPATMSSGDPLRPVRTTSEQREERNSGQLARLSGGIHSRSLGAAGVPDPEHKENLGPQRGENRQGSAPRPVEEDKHRSQRRLWTRDNPSRSQGISGVSPCLAPADSSSVASVGSQSLCRVRGFRRRQNKIELKGIEHKDDDPIRSLPRLCNLRLSVAQRSGRPNTGSDV